MPSRTAILATLVAATASISMMPSFAHADQDLQRQKPIIDADSGASSLDNAAIVPPDYQCFHPAYKIHLVSKSPSVIYITDFITPDERAHLQAITKDTFTHSRVSSATTAQGSVNKVRKSSSTAAPATEIVSCIEERALLFQGLSVPRSHLEPLQLVKYSPGEHYHFHTDWFTDPAHSVASVGGNRISSFFAYVKADNVTGGGTNFPMLEVPNGGTGGGGESEWCRFIDCDEPWENGVTFKPIEGNAVYWENMHVDGSGQGDQRTLHAGLPVTSGEKIGMNIWTRQAPLSEDMRGTVGSKA